MVNLDQHVAIVTGAGRGIGRSHALLLAELGSSAIVNDIDAVSAQSVCDEIRATGGRAVVSLHDVASEEGGSLIAETAIRPIARSMGI
jgi:NAD(P)-dependent dehydrogenase (short-subunit alcohol dehydrogenase family)